LIFIPPALAAVYAQNGRAYTAAGQTGACLNSMSISQTYQADLLRDLDDSEGMGPYAVRELCWATDRAVYGSLCGRGETALIESVGNKRKRQSIFARRTAIASWPLQETSTGQLLA